MREIYTNPLIGISTRSEPGSGLLSLPLYAIAQTYVWAVRAAKG